LPASNPLVIPATTTTATGLWRRTKPTTTMAMPSSGQ